MSYAEADSFCKKIDGRLAYASELNQICGYFVLRPNEKCGEDQCMGSVRVADEWAGHHKLWHDMGFHFENQECGRVVYYSCGTQVKDHRTCDFTEFWTKDQNKLGFVCIKDALVDDYHEKIE